MIKRINSLTVVILFAAFGVTSAFAAKGEPYSDEWIEGRISGAYAYNASLDSTDLSVDVDGGVATLTGNVPSEVEKEYAEKIARATEGVRQVKNELGVDQSLKLKNRSSFSQKIKDASISASIKSKLLANKNTHGLSIDVDVQGNMVTLTGDVASQDEKKLAGKIASDTSGVQEVRNNLNIKTNTTGAKKEESKDLATAVSDAWISTRVRSMLTFNSDFTGSDIDISTTNGKVKIDGYARSPEQKSLAGEVVKDVHGVVAVDNNLVVRKSLS